MVETFWQLSQSAIPENIRSFARLLRQNTKSLHVRNARQHRGHAFVCLQDADAKIHVSATHFLVMYLQFLEFDQSEDSDGLRTWDALANPAAVHTTALLAETAALVQHLTQQLGPAGPIDEGHHWDMDLLIHGEAGQPLTLEANAPLCGRITLALSLSGGAELAQQLL